MLLREFVGNGEVIDALSAACAAGRLSHAVMLTGDLGSGKTELAKALAQTLVCRGENKPCGSCSQCVKAAAGIHSDINLLHGEGDSGSFKIDAVRSVVQNMHILPGEADCKVYIIDDAEDLTEEAVNALLKAFEEPPERVYFILTCSNRSRLLPTLRSRAAIYNLIPPAPEQTAKYLADKKLCGYDEALGLARGFGGNIGSCTAYLTDENFRAQCQTVARFFRAVAQSDGYGLQKQALELSALKRRQAVKTVRLLYAAASDLTDAARRRYPPPGFDEDTVYALGADRLSDICRALERALSLLASNCQTGAVFADAAAAMQ